MSASLHVDAPDRANALAARLCLELGVEQVDVPPRSIAGSKAWADSGLKALTVATPAMDVVEGAEALIRAARAFGCPASITMLTERAALRGFKPSPMISCGGATRMVRCHDGWAALSLARDADFEVLPALTLRSCQVPWKDIEEMASMTRVEDFTEQAQRLSLAASAVDAHRRFSDIQWRSRGAAHGPRLRRLGAPAPLRGTPLVIDLSALWAGPLSAALLSSAGARVIKVESVTRPDGARDGDARFYDLMNARKESLALDLRKEADRESLRRLMLAADVVIESARPRAFEQLGLSPESVFAMKPSLVWASVTAYGRTGPWRNRAGYGDDAAASAGLVAWNAQREPCFIGDAIADPLTGIAAALGVFASLRAGGGWLVDASLRETAAFVAAAPPVAGGDFSAAPARARRSVERARGLGQDTERLRVEFGL